MLRMSAARHVASFGALAAAGGFIGSNLAAWRLGYQAVLGSPIAHYHGWPIMAPWDIVSWAPWAGASPAISGGLIVAAGITALPLLRIAKNLTKPKFGAKEWGTMADVKKAGLLAEDGVVVGKKNGKLLRWAGDEHTLFAGASGSGKTSGPITSSLLSLRRRSVLVFDPKGELYKMTAPFRSTLGEALYFDPTERGSACFNQLDEIEGGTDREIPAVQNIASLLIDASGLKNSDPIWPITATDLLTSLIMFALTFPTEHRNLPEVRKMLWDMPAALQAMTTCDKEEVRLVAVTMLGMTPRTADAIALTARSSLSVFADPLVAEKTSRSDFRISDLVCSKYPVSLYLQVPPSDRDRLMPLFRLILLQVFKAFLWRPDHMPDGRRKLRRMQLVAEEFPAVGKIPGFNQDIQELRRYGISCMLVCQSLKSLEEIYGKVNVIRGNCHIVTCFATSDTDSMKELSTAVGPGVEIKTSTTRKHGEWFGGSKSTSENRRALIEPGEVRMLDMDDAIVLVTGTKPLRVNKVRWFKERSLRLLGVNLEKNKDVPLVQNATIAAMHANRVST